MHVYVCVYVYMCICMYVLCLLVYITHVVTASLAIIVEQLSDLMNIKYNSKTITVDLKQK